MLLGYLINEDVYALSLTYLERIGVLGSGEIGVQKRFDNKRKMKWI